MMLLRADRLTEPPIVGRWYMVPAVLWNRNLRHHQMSAAETLRDLRSKGAKWWPVWGSKHNDVEFFNFPHLHYHIDPRFLTKRHWSEFRHGGSRTPLQALQGAPLNHRELIDGPPAPVLRKMRCTLAHAQWGHPDSGASLDINESYAGQVCRSGKLGFICPHKNFSLGSVLPIDGVITCPLHGMRVHAATGLCVGPEKIEPASVIEGVISPRAMASPDQNQKREAP